MAALPPPPEAAWGFSPSEQELDGAQLKIMESHSSVSLHRSKSPASESEDEIEFVGEGPLRPILECIDLVSSEDEEPNSSSYVHRPSKRKDHIDYQKERVASTLDRLARHVEVEKQQKEEKNKAFKEKVDSQYAHGLQELEFIRGHSDTEAARLCVDQWLKMPGLKPGSVNGGKRGACKRAAQTQLNSSPKHCPVMHCNREFDNVHLLLGHLQRFDHSPCDPTVTLRGPPNNAVACVICCERFSTSQQYSDHLLSKLNENDGHKKGLPPQHIQCFACPNCFLLFTKSEQCLQHMSGKKHFLQVSQLNDEMKTGHPLPFPTYAKNLLISLCKEVPFQVKCISCYKILRSHMELTAHFRMRCHNSGPVALSKKSISQVAEIFKTKGYCENCDELFANKNQITQHKQTTQHNIRVFTTMEESILMFCHINGKQKNQSYLCHIVDRSRPLLKRHLASNESASKMGSTPSKRKSDLKGNNEDNVANQSQGSACKVKAWFCECLQKFFTEELVENHILSANRICHKCAVCGKLAENSSIIRLHMSRFHGGAHLTNFLLWCRACSADLREEDIMGHITEFHGGHSYYYEQDVEDEPMPCASDTACISAGEDKDCISSPMEVSPERSPIAGKWQCRICEEMFESEESVKQHCMSLESHAFHRYSCGLCRNHFRKVGTLERHFQEHHNQETQTTKYFCGLCGHLFFDTEEEFLIHYTEIHSTDYTFVPEQMEVSIKKEEDFLPVEQGDLLTCGCRTTYVSKINRKNDYENCQKTMLEKGNLWFRCCLCSATAQNIADLKNHLKSHTSLKPKGEMYVIRCAACNKNFNDLPSAHQHYHMKHCFLQKPDISSLASESENTVFKFTASGACQVRKPHRLQFQTSPSKTQDRPQLSPLQKPIEQRKENNEDSAHAEELSENGDLPDLDYLSTMTHIVLVDLDNWGSFFTQLPANLNQGTFIWGFQGGYSNWKPPVQCKIYNYLKRIGCFFLHPRCGTRREAADFALCVHAGRLDEHLPKQIPFTVLSGDKSFLELENQFKMTQRSACILNPHHIEGDMMCALLNSISDTTKGSDSEEDEDMEVTVKRSLEEIKNQEAFLPRVTTVVPSQNVEQDVELQEAIQRSLEEM
ncbi:E3 SUMO-protein ligase ZNF451-like isoform X1 [Chiroxiphia lanceolata]|uniref:E3 SUMO-protein ligase ZNF451-like isoform X1 n=2 Tax=Chiroxiphia lanceolata TaxID=296741 RepID=UPI0013CF0AF5|nr:E3 SUMO-protein ligase ZNF451-like isoform X1 [Chiroxiphia lanceolata]